MKQVFRVFWGCTLAAALALTATNIYDEILKNSFDLSSQNLGRDRLDPSHSLCVLSGYSRYRRGSKNPQRGKSLNIRLYSGTTATIRARDR